MRLTIILTAGFVSLVVSIFSRPILAMLDEEIRTRISRLPNAVIYLIALRFPRKVRRDLIDEWTTELEAVVSGTEGLPVTQLLEGLEYAWSLRHFQRADGRRLTGIRRRQHPVGPLPPLPDDDLLWGAERQEGLAAGRVHNLGPSVSAADGKKRRRVQAALLAIATVFVWGIATAGGVGYHYYLAYVAPPNFSGPGTGSVVVQIKPGQSATAVGDRLAALGVVASARAFSNAANSSSEGSALEPGTYRVHKHMNASLALTLLLNSASRSKQVGG